MANFLYPRRSIRLYLFGIELMYRCLPWLAMLLAVVGQPANAETQTLAGLLQPLKVAEGVYYFKGSLNSRSYENQAFNLNTGFVVTDEGVVVIDTGASRQVGAAIEQAIATVTDAPVVAVINTGSQDHRWLGNGHFAGKGIPIIALARTVQTQQAFAEQHLTRLSVLLKDRFDGTEAVTSQGPIAAIRHRVTVGDTPIELIWGGNAHFPGDIMVWLPGPQVVFSGDIVYTERLSGIHPWSSITGLQQAFATLADLQPRIVIPGHGTAGTLAKARAESGDYYDFLFTEIRTAIDSWDALDATIERLADAPAFHHLRHFDAWHRVNMHRVWLQLEMQ
jgi:glyoxylase-like metal-dependent hydrolase (beta-lactamase superfamily II)